MTYAAGITNNVRNDERVIPLTTVNARGAHKSADSPVLNVNGSIAAMVVSDVIKMGSARSIPTFKTDLYNPRVFLTAFSRSINMTPFETTVPPSINRPIYTPMLTEVPVIQSVGTDPAVASGIVRSIRKGWLYDSKKHASTMYTRPIMMIKA